MSTPGDDIGRDPGLQPERTAIAWQRTGLSAGLVSLVLALALVRLESSVLAVGASALALLTTVLAIRRFPSGARPTIHGPWPTLLRMTLIVGAIAVLAAAAALSAALG